MQRKCQSCFCRYISTVHHPALEASSPLLTALKSCRTRDFILLGGQGKDTTWEDAALSAETARLSACHEEPWQSRAERLLLVVLEEPQALWTQLLVVCVCPWPLCKSAVVQGSIAHVWQPEDWAGPDRETPRASTRTMSGKHQQNLDSCSAVQRGKGS